MNHGVIFRRALRDTRISALGWGAIMILVAALLIMDYPNRHQLIALTNQFFADPIFKVVFGEVDLDLAIFAMPEGYLGLGYFGYAPLVLAVYAVLFALDIVAGEEERGTLDLVLSTPVPRWRLIVEKFAALIVALALILLMIYAGFLVLIEAVPELEVSPWRVAEGVLNMLPVTLFMAALTLLFSTILRSRLLAGGMLIFIIAASYIIYITGQHVGLTQDAMRVLKSLSFYRYYNGAGVLLRGMNWGYFLLLSAATGVLVGLALFFFERRDIAV